MACFHTPELDDIHRWLPPEILEDIGVAKADEQRRLAVAEDLAARLAGVLGGTARRTQHHPPPPVRAANSHQHQHQHRPPPQLVHGLGSRGRVAGGNAQSAAGTCPFLSDGGRMLELAVNPPRFDPVRPPAKRSGTGTGVFLPRTEAPYPTGPGRPGLQGRLAITQTTRSHAVLLSSNASKSSAGAGRRKRQLHLHLQARAGAMAAAETLEQQAPHRANDANAAPRACLELALPHEWVY